MARQAAEQWATIVAEAECSGASHAQVAARYRVSVPALKYHLSKARKAGAAEDLPRILPARVSDERATLEAQLGNVRLSFPEGCDPAYVAAVLTALRKACLPASVRIYVAVDPVDLRRGHDGLSAIVQGQWKMDPFEGHLFVFFGRRRDRCKILFWDRGGLVRYYKRLEQGRFRMQTVASDGRSVQLDATALAMLLDGIDLGGVRRPKHWQPRVWKRTATRVAGIDKSAEV